MSNAFISAFHVPPIFHEKSRRVGKRPDQTQSLRFARWSAAHQVFSKQCLIPFASLPGLSMISLRVRIFRSSFILQGKNQLKSLHDSKGKWSRFEISRFRNQSGHDEPGLRWYSAALGGVQWETYSNGSCGSLPDALELALFWLLPRSPAL